jgi:hypothetical protein
MATRTDQELVAQAEHVRWEIRQVLELASHLEQLRRQGTTVLFDALDAAALESFLIHARALTEFFWSDHKLKRSGERSYPNDARAGDWFAGHHRGWDAGPKPAVLSDVEERVGYGVAHVSFRRIDNVQNWGWQPLDIAHHLASRFYEFASSARPNRLPEGFQATAYDMVMTYRVAVAEREPFERLRTPPQPVGTPGFATLESTPASAAALR